MTPSIRSQNRHLPNAALDPRGARAPAEGAAQDTRLIADVLFGRGRDLSGYDAVEGRLPLQRLLATESPQPRREVRPTTTEALAARLGRLQSERETKLAALDRPKLESRVVPEDLTLVPDTYHMVSSGFWLDDAMARQLARIGEIEGFRVALYAGSKDARAVAESMRGEANLDVLELPVERGREWAEDDGEIDLSGSTVTPAFIGDADLVGKAIDLERIRRFYPEAYAAEAEVLEGLGADALRSRVRRDFPEASFTRTGKVDRLRAQENKVAIGLLHEVAPEGGTPPIRTREMLSFVEGGNVIPTTAKDGTPLAIVGRDSIAISKHLLARDLGRPVDDATTLRVIAQDFGVSKVVPVEQPGEFHIDMSMGAFRPGVVVLDDPWGAARAQAKWLESDHAASEPTRPSRRASLAEKRELFGARSTWRRDGVRLTRQIAALERRADRLAPYMARMRRDLEAHGLEVHRAPLQFWSPKDPEEYAMNFANGEPGTGAKSGRTFFVTQGGDRRAEALVRRLYLETLPLGLERLYFMDPDLGRASLTMQGALNCRAKASGTTRADLSARD